MNEMNKINVIFGILAFSLVFMPGVIALEGESPAAIFDRLTIEGMILVIAVSGFMIILGAIMVIFGGASPKIRAWGAYMIISVILGNFVLVAAPWFIGLIQKSS